MARKKNTETPVTEDIQAQDPTVTLETPVVSNTESETQEKDTVESPDETTLKEPSPRKDKAEKKVDIPEFVKELLQKYPNYPALYIDSKGGVFTEDTQPNWVKDAILYQNPYYKQ